MVNPLEETFPGLRAARLAGAAPFDQPLAEPLTPGRPLRSTQEIPSQRSVLGVPSFAVVN
jgi:hypothetical protein